MKIRILAVGLGLVVSLVPISGCAASGASGCTDASGAITAIASGLNEGVTIIGPAKAVKSKDFADVWMVAAKVSSDRNNTPVWAVSTLTDPGLIFSAEAFAKLYSVWPHRVNIDAGSNGIAAAIACL